MDGFSQPDLDPTSTPKWARAAQFIDSVFEHVYSLQEITHYFEEGASTQRFAIENERIEIKRYLLWYVGSIVLASLALIATDSALVPLAYVSFFLLLFFLGDKISLWGRERAALRTIEQQRRVAWRSMSSTYFVMVDMMERLRSDSDLGSHPELARRREVALHLTQKALERARPYVEAK